VSGIARRIRLRNRVVLAKRPWQIGAKWTAMDHAMTGIRSSYPRRMNTTISARRRSDNDRGYGMSASAVFPMTRHEDRPFRRPGRRRASDGTDDWRSRDAGISLGHHPNQHGSIPAMRDCVWRIRGAGGSGYHVGPIPDGNHTTCLGNPGITPVDTRTDGSWAVVGFGRCDHTRAGTR
jgi:hypothetical protein